MPLKVLIHGRWQCRILLSETRVFSEMSATRYLQSKLVVHVRRPRKKLQVHAVYYPRRRQLAKFMNPMFMARRTKFSAEIKRRRPSDEHVSRNAQLRVGADCQTHVRWFFRQARSVMIGRQANLYPHPDKASSSQLPVVSPKTSKAADLKMTSFFCLSVNKLICEKFHPEPIQKALDLLCILILC